jgi:hypothetical protein
MERMLGWSKIAATVPQHDDNILPPDILRNRARGTVPPNIRKVNEYSGQRAAGIANSLTFRSRFKHSSRRNHHRHPGLLAKPAVACPPQMKIGQPARTHAPPRHGPNGSYTNRLQALASNHI